jgi:hypothetical protein
MHRDYLSRTPDFSVYAFHNYDTITTTSHCLRRTDEMLLNRLSEVERIEDKKAEGVGSSLHLVPEVVTRYTCPPSFYTFQSPWSAESRLQSLIWIRSRWSWLTGQINLDAHNSRLSGIRLSCKIRHVKFRNDHSLEESEATDELGTGCERIMSRRMAWGVLPMLI